jgi:hypothetical protein
MGVAHSIIHVTKCVLASVLLVSSSNLKKALSSSETSGELLPNYTVLQANRLNLHSHRDNFACLRPVCSDIRMKVLCSVMPCNFFK